MQSVAAAAGPLSNVSVRADRAADRPQARPTPEHDHFWSGVAFLGFLQISAAVLNLLPDPGPGRLRDHRAVPGSADRTRSFEPIKPWGMLGVFVLLQINQINVWFFDLVGQLYDADRRPERCCGHSATSCCGSGASTSAD